MFRLAPACFGNSVIGFKASLKDSLFLKLKFDHLHVVHVYAYTLNNNYLAMFLKFAHCFFAFKPRISATNKYKIAEIVNPCLIPLDI